MKKLSSTPDLLSRYAVFGSFASHEFALRPTFQGVATQVFSEALKAKYPALDTQVAQLSLAEPLPGQDSQTTAAQSRSYRLMSPVDVMIQCLIDNQAIALEQGFHRLTASADVLNPPALAVSMEDLQSIFNDSAPLLIKAYQEALAQFWSEVGTGDISPFNWLARMLQSALITASTDQYRVPRLPVEQGVALAALASFPDKVQRAQLTAETPLHAYLVNIQCIEDTGPRLFQLPGVVMLTREMADRSFMLTYSQERGGERFRTLQALGGSFSSHLQGDIQASLFTWALYEPPGDFFTALALTILDKQLRDIGRVGHAAQTEHWSVERLEHALDEAGAMFPFFSQQERPFLGHVMSKLPQWLQLAAPKDLLAYSQLLLAQVVGQKQMQGQTFLEGIDSMPVYAEKMLARRFQQDHPQAVINVTQIEIVELSVENLQSPSFSEEVKTLVGFALTYKGGWPIGLIEPKDRRNQPVPDWLTGSYIKDVVQELDIAAGYIALIKNLLIDDETQSLRRKALYQSQLSVQLSLLALEKKIKGESGFTESGWQVMIRLMRPDAISSVANGNVCVRPLGFYAYEGASVDWVANMFVFGSKNPDDGPFVLYRPFAAEPLHEYATWSALFNAIKQPGELQDSVLAWFADDARGYYADGGFERPHLEGVLQEAFLALLPRTQAILSTQSVVGDYFEAMFDANASALVALADKQSVSTSERRWALIKRIGWTLFNGLTFFVSGPWQKAAWLFQTLISLDSGLQARIDGDKESATQTVMDLLFNISLALLQEGLSFNARANEKLRVPNEIDQPLFTLYDDKKMAPVDTAPALTHKKLEDLKTPQAASEYSSLDLSWFSPQSQLSVTQRATLDQLAVDINLTAGSRIEVGPLTGVIDLQDKSYVQLEGKTYRVNLQPDGLFIQNDQQPAEFGPRLKTNETGQWSLDLRLGLRGGGPKKRVQMLREEKLKKADELMQQANLLVVELNSRERALSITEGLIESATGRREEFLERYELEVASWKRLFFEMIELKTKAHKLIPREGFERQLQGGWSQLALKLLKLQNYLETSRNALLVHSSSPTYIDVLDRVLADLKRGDPISYLQWIANLKLTEKFECRLFKNSINELHALDEVRARPLPRNSVLRELVTQDGRVYFERHWGAVYLETLCELLINRMATSLTPEERSAFKLFGQGPLVDTAWSQLNLRNEKLLYAKDHLNFFDQAIQEYDSAQEVCMRLMNLGSDNFRNEYLPSMIQLLSHLREFAENQMVKLIRDSESSSSEPDEPRPGPSRLMNVASAMEPSKQSNQKIIKTTKNQVLVGSLREPTDSGQEIVDIAESFNQLRVRSYRHLVEGQWEEVSAPRSLTFQPSPVKSLERLETEARTLLNNYGNVITHNRASAATARIPVEMEEILVFKARALEEVASQMQQIIASNLETQALSEARRAEVRTLSHNLESGAVRLREVGRSLRISIIKRLPPTGSNVDYLNAQGQVLIERVGGRKYMSKGQRKDYLQEYVIKELGGRELWFAHFHYQTADTPASNYDVAHLKTVQQRTWSGQSLYARAQSPKEYIEIYRAKLDKVLAERLFLSIPQQA